MSAGLGEPVTNPNPLNGNRGTEFGDKFGDGAAQTAHDRMFLGRYDRASLSRS